MGCGDFLIANAVGGLQRGFVGRLGGLDRLVEQVLQVRQFILVGRVLVEAILPACVAGAIDVELRWPVQGSAASEGAAGYRDCFSPISAGDQVELPSRLSRNTNTARKRPVNPRL